MPVKGRKSRVKVLVVDDEDMVRETIVEALEKTGWNKTKAAEHLGLKRTTLQYQIKKYGLE